MIDYNTMELFPLYIHSAYDDEFDNTDFMEYFQKYRDKYPSETVSNMGGYQSVSDIHQDIDFIPLATRLWEMIKPCADEIAEQFYHNGFPNTSLELDNMWFNINGPGNWNVTHTHPHCFYSGVVWIEASEDSGDLVFRSPHEHQTYGYGSNVHFIQPEKGRLVMFPSHLLHMVKPNESEEERYSISFNLKIKVPQ